MYVNGVVSRSLYALHMYGGISHLVLEPFFGLSCAIESVMTEFQQVSLNRSTNDEPMLLYNEFTLPHTSEFN